MRRLAICIGYVKVMCIVYILAVSLLAVGCGESDEVKLITWGANNGYRHGFGTGMKFALELTKKERGGPYDTLFYDSINTKMELICDEEPADTGLWF